MVSLQDSNKITPEELARLPEFGGRLVINRSDYGLCWSWKYGSHDLWTVIGDRERSILVALLTDRRTMERCRGALRNILDEPEDYGAETEDIKRFAREALSKED